MDSAEVVRLVFFLGIFLGVSVWETVAPRQQLTVSKSGRWFNNVGIILVDNVLVRLLLPLAAIGVATAAEQRHWGLLHSFDLPPALQIGLAILLLDLVIYLQHLMFHAVPLLWRLHMVHHADLDFDVTTGLRFHPMEIFISLGIKMAAVAALGPPVIAVIAFEVILNGTAMFNHGNICLPLWVDRFLRLLVVTPDMHRVHHSVIVRETNSNFGFNFPWWDRLFGTYRAQPVAGHEGMTIGLSQYREASRVRFHQLLIMPFVGDPGRYSLNHIGREPATLVRKE